MALATSAVDWSPAQPRCLIAAGAALGVAELIAAFFPSVQSPVLSVGNVVVDNVPSWAKDFAIRTFGENDKTALIIGTTIFLFLFAAVIGVITTKRRIAAPIGAALFGLVGAASALTRVGAARSPSFPASSGDRGMAGHGPAAVAAQAADKVFESTDRRRFPVGSSLVVAGGCGRWSREWCCPGCSRCRPTGTTLHSQRPLIRPSRCPRASTPTLRVSPRLSLQSTSSIGSIPPSRSPG
nr:hypothetical protein [Candidatus Microthrix sp.]